MCLAIPAKIIKINKNIAEVESFGVKKEIDISLTPGAKVGNFVIVHAGFAIQIIDEEDALVTQGYWKEYLGE
ncbi:MAG: HypC/HybG/HupF family hydrogenase formation chaperone [Actinobacteria bacterium]|nr:HypC/HybG/HupF family hydrogenase formation chaperone [Actinomycetota bacterium]